MTIIHDASATFGATYTTPSNGTINENGFNSLFQMTGSLADLNIVNGTTMNIGAQASLYVADIISVGTTGNGILNVDGIGAKAIAGSTTTASVFGDNGGIASVTFSNQANGSFNFGLNLAAGSNKAGAVGYLTVESGATLTGLGNVALANSSNVATTATITITDLNSAMTLANTKSLTIGQASAGTATINVNNQGLLSLGTGAGSTTFLNATGTININGGTVNLQTLVNNGGRINFNSGSLSFLGSLTVGAGGLLGTNLALDDTQQLTLNGTTTVNAGSFLQLESGAGFNTGSLTNNGRCDSRWRQRHRQHHIGECLHEQWFNSRARHHHSAFEHEWLYQQRDGRNPCRRRQVAGDPRITKRRRQATREELICSGALLNLASPSRIPPTA